MRKIGLCAVGLLAGIGCSSNHSSAPVGARGASASVAPAALASHDDAASVRAFLDARYRAEDVRHSFRTALGQDIDCIDFFAQPGVRALAARGHAITSIPSLPDLPAGFHPGEPAAADTAVATGVLFDGSPDEGGRARSCPEGTVPEVRISPEQIERAGGVEAFRKAVHTKAAPPKARPHVAPLEQGPDVYGDCNGEDELPFAHVYGELMTPYGASIPAGTDTMSLYGPKFPEATVAYGHSLAQSWTVGYNDDGTNVQTVETGWNVDNDLYDGDTHVPHLFIFSTIDSYMTTGCYNDWDSGITGVEYNDAGQVELDDAGNPVPGTCVPWVQVSRQYAPGMALPASEVRAVNPRAASTLPKELSLSTVQVAGGWWILVQVSGGPPSFLGYYPAKSFNAPMTIYWVGGEVAVVGLAPDGGSENIGNPFETYGVQMGSGQAPSEGQGYAAYHRNYSALVSGPIDGGSPLVTDAYICSTDVADYGYSGTPKPVSQADGPWVNYFYFGGTPPAPGTASGGE